MGDVSQINSLVDDEPVISLQVNVDGDCRMKANADEHDQVPLSAAVAVFSEAGMLDKYWYILPREPNPTKDRAKLMAVVMALDISLRKYKEAVYEKDGSTLKPQFNEAPRLHLKLCSDSDYAIACLTTLGVLWEKHDWKWHTGGDIENRNLVYRGAELSKTLRALGRTDFYHVPSVVYADVLCEQAIDYQNTLRKWRQRGKQVSRVWDFDE